MCISAIPTELHGGNHTPAFAKAAATKEAHAATIVVMKGLALTGIRLLNDAKFYNEVRCILKPILVCVLTLHQVKGAFDAWKRTQSLTE